MSRKPDNEGGAIITGITLFGAYDKIVANRIDSLGNFLWGDSCVLINESNLNGPWSMDFNESGVFLSWASGYVPFHVYAQHVDNSGVPSWEQNGVQISNPITSSVYPTIASTSSSEVVICWYEFADTNFVAQKFNSNGDSLWNNTGVSITYNTDRYSDRSIIDDMAEGAIVCWTEYPAVLYAQQISAEGNLGEVLSVEKNEPEFIPNQFTLLPNFPNPFNNETVIPVILTYYRKENLPQIRIYDILGREINRFNSNTLSSGINYLRWNGQNIHNMCVSSGIYILEIQGVGYHKSIPLVKIK